MTLQIRSYVYRGRLLAKLLQDESGERHFEPCLEEFGVFDLIREMNLRDKVHMKSRAYAVFRLLQHYGHNPDDYLDNEDILIHIANLGVNGLGELQRRDYRAYDLIHQRGLVGRYKHGLSGEKFRLPEPEKVSFEEREEEYKKDISAILKTIEKEKRRCKDD